MINIRTIKKLKEQGGLTLKDGKPITYKTGYQVATDGVECYNAEDAIKAVRAYRGNCGIWYNNGVWYIDRSMRVATKQDALCVGRICNQQTILKWKDMSLIEC